MTHDDHMQRYHQGQTASAAWQDERQIRLKMRVYDTFSAWLVENGGKPLTANQSLLDVGSGSGQFVSCCQENGIQARGVDISDGINLETDALPVATDSQDVVTAISLIEHLHSPANLLREVQRVLKPGGAFILVTPNWKYSSQDFFDDPTHVHPYTPSSLSQLLDMYGYENVEIAPWLVKKPNWMWRIKARYAYGYWCLPFRGDAPGWIPGWLKGRTASLLAFATKEQISSNFSPNLSDTENKKPDGGK